MHRYQTYGPQVGTDPDDPKVGLSACRASHRLGSPTSMSWILATGLVNSAAASVVAATLIPTVLMWFWTVVTFSHPLSTPEITVFNLVW